MIRYILSKDPLFLWASYESSFASEDHIDTPFSRDKIYVNILEKRDPAYKVKLYYSNGAVLEGWIPNITRYVGLEGAEELFDGRFNQ
jgi:hypothetical protein